MVNPEPPPQKKNDHCCIRHLSNSDPLGWPTSNPVLALNVVSTGRFQFLHYKRHHKYVAVQINFKSKLVGGFNPSEKY